MHDDETPAPTTDGRAGSPEPQPLFASPRAAADAAGESGGHEGTTLTEPADARSAAAASSADATTEMPPVDAGAEHVVDAGSTGPGDGVAMDGDHQPRRRRWWLAAIPLVLVLAVAGWIGSLFDAREGQAMPGVTVEGFDAGGMTGEEIAARLDQIVTDRRSATITVTAADQAWDYSLGEQGYTADVDATVEEALSAGRDGPVGSVLTHVRASRGQTSWDVPLDGIAVDRDVDEFLATIDEAIDLEPTAGGVTFDPETLDITSEVPQEGFDARPADVREDLVGLLGTGQPAELSVEVDTIEPLVDPANVEATVARLESVLAESYVLSAADDSVTIDPSEVAPALSVVETDEGYDVALDRAPIRELLADGRGDKFAVSPRSASYEVVSGGGRTFDDKGSATFDPSPAQVDLVEGRNGREFNPDVAADLVVSLYDAGEHAGEFELDVVEATFTNEEAQAARPDALLGTFTTYHDAGGNRVHNIQLLADLIDGEMLPPGDDFSVNRDIGDRTEEKGFLPDGTIINGELEDSIGGGVSQVATTFYNAAFFAGIQIRDWKPHSWPISRYPLAREATFSYAANYDVRILNDTEGALIVKTSHTDTSITFSIFGQDDGRETSAIMGEPYDYSDFDVERRTTDEIPSGATRTVQVGAEGFKVDYTRVVEGGVNPGSRDYSWTYSPKDTIIETGE